MKKNAYAPPQMNAALLPNGFSDLLPPEAGQETDAVTDLLSTFKAFGYHRIKPPMVEFEDSLFAPGPGAALIHDTFRVMDPVSHRMMGIRSDTTAQITRIATSRMKENPRPLRLCYANDVLRTRGSQQRITRQFTQVGCELVGADNADSDIEVAVIAVKSLVDLGIGGLTIDLNLPRLTDLVLAQDNGGVQTQEKQSRIIKAVGDRDLDALKSLASDNKSAQDFYDILLQNGQPDTLFQVLSKFEGAAIKSAATQLKYVYDGLRKALQELDIAQHTHISVDVLETTGMEYHHGIGFGLYSATVKSVLGRGGRYTSGFDEEDAAEDAESATGFTLYMDSVKQALPVKARSKCIAVPADEGWNTLKNLQEQGWITVRISGQKDNQEIDCTHIYKNGKIEDIT